MGKEMTINIAREFSRFPAGRVVADGPFSGEAFRKNLLIPAFDKAECIIVNLDGSRGYGSSFLEEAFGGLVRDGVSKARALSVLNFISEDDPSLPSVIRGYIEHGDA